MQTLRGTASKAHFTATADEFPVGERGDGPLGTRGLQRYRAGFATTPRPHVHFTYQASIDSGENPPYFEEPFAPQPE